MELADRPLEELLDEVVERLVQGRPEDDVALVAGCTGGTPRRPEPPDLGPFQGVPEPARGPRRGSFQVRSRRTVALRPLIMVARNAWTTSSAADSGTSTSANR